MEFSPPHPKSRADIDGKRENLSLQFCNAECDWMGRVRSPCMHCNARSWQSSVVALRKEREASEIHHRNPPLVRTLLLGDPPRRHANVCNKIKRNPTHPALIGYRYLILPLFFLRNFAAQIYCGLLLFFLLPRWDAEACPDLFPSSASGGWRGPAEF